MSDSSVTVVALTLDEAAAPERAAAVVRWLVDLGVVERTPGGPAFAGLRAGPGVLRAATSWSPKDAELARGVDVLVGRRLHHPIANFEPPACPACGAPLNVDDARHTALVDAWLGGEEPTTPCAACGWAALLGDWPGDWMFAVGTVAVCFDGWPPLRDDFVLALRARLGPRTRVVTTRM